MIICGNMTGDLKFTSLVLSQETLADKFIKSLYFPVSTLVDTVDLSPVCQPAGDCVFAENRLMATPGPLLLNQYVVMHEGKTQKYNSGAKLPVSCFDGFIVPSAFVKNTLLTSWVGGGLGW